MNRIRGRVFAAVTAVAVTLSGSAWAQETLVKMTSARIFVPHTVEIHVGETVVWYNDSMAVHTVTADPSRAKTPDNVSLPTGVAPFSSQHILPSSYYRHTFTAPGTYRYIDIHAEEAGMMGEVVVR